MKRRVARYVAGACIAGMVAGVPGVAFADQVAEDGAVSSWSASEDMNVALYGPPSAFEDSDDWPVQVLYGPPPIEDAVVVEPVQTLYGPPSVFAHTANPMKVSANPVTVKETRLAQGKKVVKKAIVVKKAKGDVRYSKIAETSSKRIRVNATTGAIIVKKDTKRGTYKAEVQVTASGNAKYRPAVETVVVKVRVK